MANYKIGEFSKITNLSKSTLQAWDRNGTLKAYRTPTNRRYYTDEHLKKIKGDFYLNINELTNEEITEQFIKTYESTFQSRFDSKISGIERIFFNKENARKELPTKIRGTRVLVDLIETIIHYKINIRSYWYILQFKKTEYDSDDYKDRLDINIIDLG